MCGDLRGAARFVQKETRLTSLNSRTYSLAGMKRLILWTNLLALAACARALPPAPTGLAPVAAIPGVRLPERPHLSAGPKAAADSAVNDLADATPEDHVVPAFASKEVSWDIDVHSFADHPRVQ